MDVKDLFLLQHGCGARGSGPRCHAVGATQWAALQVAAPAASNSASKGRQSATPSRVASCRPQSGSGVGRLADTDDGANGMGTSHRSGLRQPWSGLCSLSSSWRTPRSLVRSKFGKSSALAILARQFTPPLYRN